MCGVTQRPYTSVGYVRVAHQEEHRPSKSLAAGSNPVTDICKSTNVF